MTLWAGVSCQDGRVTAVDLRYLEANGPLEGFGLLTGLTELQLAQNRFSGAWKEPAPAPVYTPAAAAAYSCDASIGGLEAKSCMD